MPQFKLIKGSYEKLLSKLLPEFPTNPQSNKENSDLIQRDLNRTSYFSANLAIDSVKDRLSNEFVRHTTHNRYLQGDFEACLGLIHYQALSDFDATLGHVADNMLKKEDYIDLMRVCYLNDANELCGLCIFISADTSTAPTAPPREYRYGIAICRNVTELPENRDVVILSDIQLISSSVGAEYITTTDILNQVNDTLQCPVLYQAIRPFLLSGSVGSRKAFDILKDCIKPNQNCFDKVSDIVESQKAPLARYQQSLDDILQPDKEKALNQSFLTRYCSPIIVVSACFLIGATACATMVMFAGPVVLTLAALALCVDLFMGYYTINTILQDENELVQYETARDESLANTRITFENEVSGPGQ